MSCKNVSLILNEEILTGELFVTDDREQLSLRHTPDIKEKGKIVLNRCIESPGDVLTSAVQMGAKLVLPGGEHIHAKTEIQQFIDLDIKYASKTLWTRNFSQLSYVRRQERQITVGLRQEAASFRLLFPSEGKAALWESIIRKHINGEDLSLRESWTSTL